MAIIHSKEQFDGLVKNAIDFFGQALKESEIQEKPKYSLINFASGIELILKARLMHEHWTLILENIDNTDVIKFKNGDFKSINTEKSIERIKKLGNEMLIDKDLGDIKNIFNHRNKVMHFFEPSYLDINDPKHKNRIEIIVKEEYKAWYRLYKIINERWKEIFKDFQQELRQIDQYIHENSIFLQTKFDVLSFNLQQKSRTGTLILNCDCCRYCSAPQLNRST